MSITPITPDDACQGKGLTWVNSQWKSCARPGHFSVEINTMGISAHTGVTMIADGTEEADIRLEACLTTDAGIGIVRHAQAGYPMARRVAEGAGPLTDESINIPLWWKAEANFGPSQKRG